jgi:hypothetical protein
MAILCHAADNVQRFLPWSRTNDEKKKGGGHSANRPQFFTVGAAYQAKR